MRVYLLSLLKYFSMNYLVRVESPCSNRNSKIPLPGEIVFIRVRGVQILVKMRTREGNKWLAWKRCSLRL